MPQEQLHGEAQSLREQLAAVRKSEGVLKEQCDRVVKEQKEKLEALAREAQAAHALREAQLQRDVEAARREREHAATAHKAELARVETAQRAQREADGRAHSEELGALKDTHQKALEAIQVGEPSWFSELVSWIMCGGPQELSTGALNRSPVVRACCLRGFSSVT